MHFGLDVVPSPSLARSASFLSELQPVLANGLQLTTNVRVTASDEPFPTVAAMVEDLVRNAICHVVPSCLCLAWAGKKTVRTSALRVALQGLLLRISEMCWRDASENLIRTRILEWELKLLRAENEMVSNRLEIWVEYIMRANI